MVRDPPYNIKNISLISIKNIVIWYVSGTLKDHALKDHKAQCIYEFSLGGM